MGEFKDNRFFNYFTYDELVDLYNISDLYVKAKVIVSELFKDKVDKAGKPYIGHLISVSDKLDDYSEKVAGLLHDTLEDTDIRYEDLLKIGFTEEILEIVKLVTKENIDTSNMTKEEKLHNYNKKIDSIINSGNIHAIRLKIADMSDNYNPERLKELPEEKQEWFREKYKKQLEKLREALDKMEDK